MYVYHKYLQFMLFCYYSLPFFEGFFFLLFFLHRLYMELFLKLRTDLHFTSPTKIFLWPNELFQGSPSQHLTKHASHSYTTQSCLILFLAYNNHFTHKKIGK
jgi:hypothetical protein